MGALEAVLQLKAQERAREEANSQAIGNAIQIFNQARQQALSNQLAQLQQAQSEKKYQSDLTQQAFENTIKSSQQRSMEEYLKLIGGQSPGSATTNNTIPPQENAVPSLQDAFPNPQQKFIQTPYLSPQGKVGMSNKLDPAYSKELEIRNSQIKEFEDYGSALEKLSTRIEVLDKAIDATPEFKEGFASKLMAKGTNALADINNEKWFTDYDQAFNKTFLPAAQAEGMSKVMSDLDLKTQIKSLGDPAVPRSVKKQALEQIRMSLADYTKSKIKAMGGKEEVLASIYPKAAKTFKIGNSETGLTPEKRSRLEELRKKRAEGTLK